MSHTENNITLICYDITSNKLRGRIDKAMKDFGVRLQYSIFLCRLDPENMSRCKDRLRNVLTLYHEEKESGDSLIIFEQLRPGNADCLLGANIERETPRFEII